MKRPLKDVRPIGPLFRSQYSQDNIRQFESTSRVQKATINKINDRERQLEAIDTSGEQVQFVLTNVSNRRSTTDKGNSFKFDRFDAFIGRDGNGRRNMFVVKEGKPVIKANINNTFRIFKGADMSVPGRSRSNIVIFQDFNSLAEAPSNNIVEAESININLDSIEEVSKDLPGATREITTTERTFTIDVEKTDGSESKITANVVRFGNSRFNPEIVNTEVTIRRYSEDSQLGIVQDGKEVYVTF
jgi:hypothetical protein